MRDSAGNAGRIGAVVSATVILLLPALGNGFPLLEWDTGGYLARWFEGYLVPSRSTTYGLFLLAGSPLDFWPVVLLQALAAVWVVALLLRTHRLAVYPFALPAVIAALTLSTALPWLASELLTDIFAGLAVIAFHILVWRADRVTAGERLALVVFIALAASTHSGTFAVLIALGAAAVVAAGCSAKFVGRAGVAPMIASLVLGAGTLLVTNYALSRTLAWTPGGYGLAFGRMLQDGIVTRYLNDHCPDPQLKLCPYRNELPLDADSFLWDGGVFNRLGRFAGLGDEMRTIVLGSLRDYPVMQLKAALVDTAKQLTMVATGEGVLTTIWHTYGMVERYAPWAAPAMRAARQQRGEIGFDVINMVHVPVALASVALLPFVAVVGLWSADFADLGSLAGTIMLALLANAACCSVISHAQDRYGSRLVWLAPLVVGLLGWRAVERARSRRAFFPRAPSSSLRGG